MKYKITSLMLFLFTALASILFYRDLFSWGLFNVFSDRTFSQEGLSAAEEFDPDRDILYLPELKGKDFFESVQDLSICRRSEVRRFIYIYLTTGRDFTVKSIERSFLYEEVIKDVFKEHSGMPGDLAMLPLLESGFNPAAVSRTGATGLWQIMRPTSERLGLRTNRWIDERRDIKKSTAAAVRHLKNLYGIFGSWELALAAYNGGGSHVKKAMLSSGSGDFWALCESGLLREESEEFVPRFAALLLIYRNQWLFGIKDEILVPEKIPSDTLTLEYPVRIKDITRIAKTDSDEIIFFNPGLNTASGFTPPGEESYTLRMRPESIDRLREDIDSLYRYRFTGLKKYTVRKGDSVSRIAEMHKKKALL